MDWATLRQHGWNWIEQLRGASAADAPVIPWMIAAAVFLTALLVFYLIKWIAQRRLGQLAARTTSGWDDAVVTAIQQTRPWLMVIVAAYLASGALVLPPGISTLLQRIAVLAFILQAGLWGNLIIDRGLQSHAQRKLQGDPASLMTITALVFIGKLALFTLLLLLALGNVGINVSALITGLGIGGIAVALAVQNVLGDLLASMSIVFDKPFVPGDFIIVGDSMGTVERIGLKTTRLTSLSGEQLVFSNADLLQSRIRNFKRMQQRRAVFNFAIARPDSLAVLPQIPELLRQTVQAQPKTRFDRAHLKDFNQGLLNYEVVYYVLASEMNLYMDIQQAINLELLQRLADLGIALAHPTQSVVLQGPSERPPAAASWSGND